MKIDSIINKVIKDKYKNFNNLKKDIKINSYFKRIGKFNLFNSESIIFSLSNFSKKEKEELLFLLLSN